jgi:predicted nucleic acid-binding protein
MKRLFVDTAGWMSMADKSDRRHLDFIQIRNEWLEQGGILVTTDYIIDETLTLIRIRLGVAAAEKWWEHVSGSPRLQVEWIGVERAERALGWFFRWGDQAFSFTDCTSFVVMRELSLKLALTGDRHFITAGFETLP